MNPINLDVLLIEDNLNDANLISELLDDFDTTKFNIKHYTQLRDGLSSIKTQKFDVILLDISLPDSYGIETISQVLNITHNIPIIVLTGEDDDILAVKSVKKGAQDYLVKGQFDKISLIRSIKYAIERKRLELNLKESREKLIDSEANLRFLNEELEKKVQERTYVLNKRVKELSCLFDICEILEEPKITIKNAFQKVVDRIPASMQYPEIACSRIVFDDHEFKTINFEETNWKLSTEIKIDSKAAGIIEIIYTLEKQEYYEGPFLKEERYLINQIAEKLRKFIEHRQVEDAMRLTHKEFAAIFNTAGGGMRVVDTDYNVLRINSPFAKLAGSSEAELADQKCYEQFPGPHCRTPRCTMNRILAGEERIDIEIVKNRKDGKKIPCMLVATPLRGADGKLIGMVEDFRDITYSKKAEAAAKQAHAEITTIFNAAGDGMRVVNTDYIVLRANQTFLDLVGMNKAEIVNKKCFEHFPHPNCHTQQCTLRLILAGEDRVETEVVKERSDGSKVPCILVATPFLSTDGELLGMVEVFKDITERKQSEEILRESEEKFRTLVKTSPYSIALLDTKGNILDCNQITEKHLNLPRNEIINTNVMNLDIISGNDKYLISNVVQELMKSRITEPKEFEFVNKKGEKVWLENIISYVKIGGKDYIQVISVDITERKNMEIMREKEVEKLKELDTLKDYFVLRLSHELKTPLNSIYSASTILLKYYHQSFDERVKKLVKIINAGGERLNQLIKDLLDVSRIESNIFELNKQKVNIVDIIKNVVNDLYYLIIKRELFLNINLEEDYNLEVDKIRFDQVIINLVSNAIKNTPRRGNISISLQECDDYIDIKVKDTGVGFTEEEKKRVFKKFGKIERYGKGMDIVSEGSGLGLYISKKIVELHGGKILLESEGRDRGSTLIVRLPKK